MFIFQDFLQGFLSWYSTWDCLPADSAHRCFALLQNNF